MTLARVPAIVGEIKQIIEQISARRAGRQGQEYPGHHQIKPGLGLVRGDEWNEDERVLDPLVWAQGSETIERTAAQPGT